MEEGLSGLGAGGGAGVGVSAGGVSPLAALADSPWHQHAAAYALSGGCAYHRLLAETTHSSSVYHQPEGGILSGHGVLDDTLSLFMVQVRRCLCMARARGIVAPQPQPLKVSWSSNTLTHRHQPRTPHIHANANADGDHHHGDAPALAGLQAPAPAARHHGGHRGHPPRCVARRDGTTPAAIVCLLTRTDHDSSRPH